MNGEHLHRLFDYREALEHPLTMNLVAGIGIAIVVSGALIQLLGRAGVLGSATFRDCHRRWRTWIVLVACILLPMLAGPFWTMLAVTLLSLGCYYEYARMTRLVDKRWISATVELGILALAFAAFDHYERLYFAAGPLTVGLLAVITIPQDRPQGYVNRVALGAFGFVLCGFSLGYLSLMANARNFQPVLILLILAVSLNDIFAYCCGKAFGRRKMLPNTSPGKTMAGSLGALLLTTLLVVALGRLVFEGTPMERWDRLAMLGLLLSVLGQLGDLLLSSIKRDVGTKDTGDLLSGHGGLLDRFDSLLLTPPVLYHFLSLHLGPWASQEPARIITG